MTAATSGRTSLRGAMSGRRATGALEAEVLDLLWASSRPLTARDLVEAMDGALAYTTVMTVLTRLWEKDLLAREPVGRAYAYRPRYTEAEVRARDMREVLRRARDRRAVLSHFVDDLSAREARALRAMLDELEQR